MIRVCFETELSSRALLDVSNVSDLLREQCCCSGATVFLEMSNAPWHGNQFLKRYARKKPQSRPQTRPQHSRSQVDHATPTSVFGEHLLDAGIYKSSYETVNILALCLIRGDCFALYDTVAGDRNTLHFYSCVSSQP